MFVLEREGDEQFDLNVVKGSFRRFLAKDMAQEWNNQHYKKDVRSNAIDMPFDVTEMAGNARSFVAEITGVQVDAPVYYFECMDNQVDGYLAPGSGYVAVQRVDVSDDTEKPISEYQRHMKLTSVLVHEFMHVVDMQRRRMGYVDIREKGRKSKQRTACIIGSEKYDFRVGSMEDGMSTVGSFFNEAFAEWGAALYRERVDPSRQKDGPSDFRTSVRGYPRLHTRYIDTSADLQGGSWRGSIQLSAIPAEAVKRLSDYTGVDLFQLKMDMLTPDKALEAERKFIQTIEGLERGLYATLRDSPYTKKGFIHGYRAVNHAIESDRQRKAKQAKAAKHLARLTNVS